MNKEEKQQAIDNQQKYIDSLPWKSTIPYPYCCVCFSRLTADNISCDVAGRLHNVCLDCEDKV